MNLGGPLYSGASRLLGLALPGVMRARVRKGKEDPARIHERFARRLPPPPHPGAPRLWLHGASVGESLVNLTLAEAIAARHSGLTFLFTSHTATSASLLAGRIAAGPLNGRALHQMAPIDTPAIAARFLDHWSPALAIFAEGEIWPNLIRAARRRAIPLALVNARMTEKSVRGWTRFAGFARTLFAAFDVILAADERTAAALTALAGRPVTTPGNLKTAAAPPPADPEALAALHAALAGRSAWLAASTHPGEEEIALDALAARRPADPAECLILQPRHPERGDAIEALIRTRGLTLARRTRGETPGPGTAVYLADTLGETGLLVRLSRAVFLGGASLPGIGGHNPVEMIRLERPVATGPHAFNFEAMMQELSALRAVTLTPTAADLARWLDDTPALPDLSGWEAGLRAPLTATLAALSPFLQETRHA